MMVVTLLACILIVIGSGKLLGPWGAIIAGALFLIMMMG